jgi:hypothetical protein
VQAFDSGDWFCGVLSLGCLEMHTLAMGILLFSPFGFLAGI